MTTRLFNLACCAIACVAVLVASAPAGAQDDAPQRIAFQEVEQAFANGVANERVTVLVFGAKWCGVCKKVERSVFTDPEVREAAQAMSWAKIDIDKQPEIAAMLGVRAVPTMIFLNTKGEVLHEHVGDISVKKMKDTIAEFAGKANEPGAARGKWNELFELTEKARALPAGEDVPSDIVLEIVELLADPDPIGVEQTRHRLVAMGPAVWNGLIDAMGNKRLKIRAAAYDLLKQTTGQTLAFDPFLKPGERREQIDAWRSWLDTNRPEPEDQAKPTPEDGADTPGDKPRDKPAKPRPTGQQGA